MSEQVGSRLETLQRWWTRIHYYTPPWAWQSDPYLKGIDEATFKRLLEMDESPETES